MNSFSPSLLSHTPDHIDLFWKKKLLILCKFWQINSFISKLWPVNFIHMFGRSFYSLRNSRKSILYISKLWQIIIYMETLASHFFHMSGKSIISKLWQIYSYVNSDKLILFICLAYYFIHINSGKLCLFICELWQTTHQLYIKHHICYSN